MVVSEIERVLDQLHEQHRASAEDPVDHLLPGAEFFRHVQQTQSFYPALLRGLSSDPHYLAVHRYLRDQTARQLAVIAGSRTLSLPRDLIADYLAGALLTLVHWWLDHGMDYTPEQMEAIVQQFVMPGVRALPDHEEKRSAPSHSQT